MYQEEDQQTQTQVSPKSYATAVILSGIFGVIGIHHFYLGRVGHGLIDLLLTIVGLSLLYRGAPIIVGLIIFIDIIHTLIVTIMLLVGNYKDGDGKIVAYPGQKI